MAGVYTDTPLHFYHDQKNLEDKTMQGFIGTYAIYFHSRKRMADTSTWGKEKMPSDYTEQEVAEAARIAGCEGYAIVENNQVKTMKWFKN
jgi:kynurenine formamidase